MKYYASINGQILETDSVLMAIQFWGDNGKLHYTAYTANGIYAVA